MTYVLEALELEDTVKNYERRKSTGWFVFTYISDNPVYLLYFSSL